MLVLLHSTCAQWLVFWSWMYEILLLWQSADLWWYDSRPRFILLALFGIQAEC